MPFNSSDRALPFKGAYLYKETFNGLHAYQLREPWLKGDIDITWYCLNCLMIRDGTELHETLWRYKMLDESRLRRVASYRKRGILCQVYGR